MDSQRRVHAVWDVRNRQGLGEAVYYAMLESDHEQWSQPITLQTTKGGDYQAAWPSIVINKDELFVMYDYEFPPTRWMRRSRDGGQTWTSPIAPFAFLVGETGAPVFLNDSSNTLHLFFSMRTRDTTIGGLFHSQWLGSQWSAVDGIQTAAANSREVAPSRPAGVVSQGNVLLAAWRKDPALPGNGIWYSYVTVNSPELPLEALPTRDAKPTAAPTRVLPQPTAVNQHVNPLPDRDANLPTSSPQDSSDVSAQGVGQSQTSFIIWAAAFPVLAMIGFIVLMHARDRLRY